MNVTVWVWTLTVAALVVLLAADLVIVDRHPHRIRLSEAARWVVVSILLAVLFGCGVWAISGMRYASEFFAGYLTEYSLSVDNLFVFVLLMSAFAVPAIHQHRVLLVGVLTALLLRGLFIAAGSAAVARFDAVFYLFGAVLGVTAWHLARSAGGPQRGHEEGRLLRVVRRVMPMTGEYAGGRLTVKVAGRRHITPMLVVMIAIGVADVLFAVDSIPAIFGLTTEPFLVFTANAFALLGLRQLYFLIGGLLSRLVYLNAGLAVIVGFIGVKLELEALASSGVAWSPEIGILPSLAGIVIVLAVTVGASVVKLHRDRAASGPLARTPLAGHPVERPTHNDDEDRACVASSMRR